MQPAEVFNDNSFGNLQVMNHNVSNDYKKKSTPRLEPTTTQAWSIVPSHAAAMDMFTASPNIGEANPATDIDQSKNNETSSIFASENI